eukprot:TRINITY_DN13669_c0_g1_i1.p1 TRINITY_DN13669_c0_g1~~TRINITY_DN13669_c0_g1_i1.p1  ORF type:complete len:192 (+),score=26.24 TRINITY_DN13669_c0_g1_i1:117-692(+)
MAHIYHLVVVGVGGVGKSCLTLQYICEKFIEEYDPTLEDSYRKQVTVDGEEFVLEIHDTAGQEDYSAVRDQYMRTGDGFLCVYSITLRSSFDEVETFYNQILRVKDLDVIPFVLCGNKADLERDRKVSREDGQNLANRFECKFLETSAKMNHNVKEIFTQVIYEIRRFRTEVPQVEKKKEVPQKRRLCLLL